MSSPEDRRRLTDPPEPITDEYADWLGRLVRGEARAVATAWPLAVNDLLAEREQLKRENAEARELLMAEREWAGCSCHVLSNEDHVDGCTGSEWLERYEAWEAQHRT